MNSKIRTLDFSPLLQRNVTQDVKASVGHSLLKALSGVGFVVIENSALNATKIEPMLHHTRQMFDLPSSDKASFTTTGRTNGFYTYESVGGSVDPILAFNACNPHVVDLLPLRKDYFERSQAWKDLDDREVWAKEFRAEKARWPCSSRSPCRGLPGFRAAMTEWSDACTETSTIVLGALALALGLPEAHFVDSHDKADHVLELKRYPAFNTTLPEHEAGEAAGDAGEAAGDAGEAAGDAGEGGVLRLPDHLDLTSLTFLAQDVPAGLEVWDDEAFEWLRVPVFRDAVLLNAGLFLQKWTSGEIKATRHRVVARPGDIVQRHSAVFFVTPNWESELAPAPTRSHLLSTAVQEGFEAALGAGGVGGKEGGMGLDTEEVDMVGDFVPFG